MYRSRLHPPCAKHHTILSETDEHLRFRRGGPAGPCPLIAACTRLLELPEGPRVLSVEAGYGEGKTIFARLWRDALADGPHRPVLFNAWEADGADDPLMAFMAALAAAVPAPEGGEDGTGRGTRFWNAGKALFMTSARTVGRAVLREGMDELTDGIGDILKTFGGDLPADLKEEFAAIEAFVKAQDGDLDKALVGELSAQFAALRLRDRMRKHTLDTIHDALIGTEGSEGKVVVLINELDRCRPDFAVGLLEAIKHLFENHLGFRFALMLNPGRLEATAGAMFGVAEGGERYLTKFIDQRLRLPAPEEGRRRFMEYLARPEWLGGFTPWVKGMEVLGNRDTLDLALFCEEHRFSLREISHAFETARLTFIFYHNKPIEPTFLIALTLCLHRSLEGPLLIEDDRTGFEKRHRIVAAATNAYRPLEAFVIERDFFDAISQWKEDNVDGSGTIQDDPNLVALRDRRNSFSNHSRAILGTFEDDFGRSRLAFSPVLRSVLLERRAEEGGHESLSNLAIRSFVTRSSSRSMAVATMRRSKGSP